MNVSAMHWLSGGEQMMSLQPILHSFIKTVPDPCVLDLTRHEFKAITYFLQIE